ncbi:MAG: DNA-binding LytR/AlgR family response regulator [Pseudoalteromonas tetraodonis]
MLANIYARRMKSTRVFYLLGLLLLVGVTASEAQLAINIEPDVVVCPAQNAPIAANLNSPVPDFDSPDCQLAKFWKVNPQGTEIWLKARLLVPLGKLQTLQPLGLFISAKMSSEVYLNNKLIGYNGMPGSDLGTEFPGRMDAFLFVPRSAVNDGSNELVMRVSSHLGFLNLSQSIHWIGLDTYQVPTAERLEHYWPSLLPFGVLFLGALCFGLLAIIQRRGWQTAFLPLMSLFAAGQLCFEVSRGLVAYLYPFHETRLIMILIFSVGFGLCLLAHILTLVTISKKRLWFAAGAVLTFITLVLTPGFDGKSSLAIAVPTMLSLMLTTYLMIRKRQQARNLILALGGFLLLLLLAPGAFLDIYFFYIVASFLAVLFVQQVLIYAKEREARVQEQARGDKLQLIIDQNETEVAKQTLRVSSSNKSELVSVADIAYCKGAGDYVELVLTTGSTVLHNDSLNDLEQNLPSTFLRVHRSFIVNTGLISLLHRKTSGTGEIELKNGQRVPVSRRIMPNVKERLVS